jgi:excisionase family DNA binding protein
MATWLILEGAVRYLKIGKSSLNQFAREGCIPAHKYGRVWRFDQKELDGWMKSRAIRRKRPAMILKRRIGNEAR